MPRPTYGAQANAYALRYSTHNASIYFMTVYFVNVTLTFSNYACLDAYHGIDRMRTRYATSYALRTSNHHGTSSSIMIRRYGYVQLVCNAAGVFAYTPIPTRALHSSAPHTR